MSHYNAEASWQPCFIRGVLVFPTIGLLYVNVTQIRPPPTAGPKAFRSGGNDSWPPVH